MKITVNKKVKTVRFADISHGDLFVHGGYAYVKLNEDFVYPTYRLGERQGGHRFAKDDKVTPVEEIILIEESAS